MNHRIPLLACLLAFSPLVLADEVLVVLETRADGTRAYLPLRLADGALSTGEAIVRPGRDAAPADGTRVRRSERPLPDAADGERLYVALAREGGAARLERIDLAAGGGSRAVDLERVPVSLFAIDERCYAGGVGWVGVAEFGGAGAESRVVHRYEPADKPVDFFVRDGRRLIAVDDIAMPFYAHVFDLDEAGAATFSRTVRLPSLVNGHYVRGIAAGGRLIVLVTFSVMDAWGHALASLPIERLGIDRFDEPLNSRSTRDGYVEESVRRAPPGGTTLLAGDELTALTGLGAIGESILAAAGPRGVLVATLPLGPETRGSLVDVGGDCLDLVVRGERALALAATASGTELVVLERAPGGLAVAARHALPGRPERFVR